MAHYVHDDLNNRVVAYSAQEFLNVLAQAIEDGDLDDITADSAFITMIKSVTDNTTYKIGFCTQAVYNELEAQGQLESNTLYFITDDSSYGDLETAISNLASTVTSHDTTIGNLSTRTATLEERTTLTACTVASSGASASITKAGLYSVNFTNELGNCNELISIEDLTTNVMHVGMDWTVAYAASGQTISVSTNLGGLIAITSCSLIIAY